LAQAVRARGGVMAKRGAEFRTRGSACRMSTTVVVEEPRMASRLNGKRAIMDCIYSAAARPEQWPEARTSDADHIGAIGGMLAFNAPEGQRSFLINGRLDEDLGTLYLQRHVQNPWATAVAGSPFGQPVVMSSRVDSRSLRRTPFHADILIPQRIEDCVSWC